MKISAAYDLILRVAGPSGKFTTEDMADLAKNCASADSEMLDDGKRFSEAIKLVEQALSSESEDQLVSALIHLRLASMAMSTNWDNLTDAISALFERRAIRAAP
jgi:hypothetical protein